MMDATRFERMGFNHHPTFPTHLSAFGFDLRALTAFSAWFALLAWLALLGSVLRCLLSLLCTHTCTCCCIFPACSASLPCLAHFTSFAFLSLCSPPLVKTMLRPSEMPDSGARGRSRSNGRSCVRTSHSQGTQWAYVIKRAGSSRCTAGEP